ncbi:MAG: flagellar biosynthetic protein FliR, partial [Nitrospirae bacterium]|nr:flagellar biosynthetic protein FliR [Fimbriimonadaceae bacterium]
MTAHLNGHIGELPTNVPELLLAVFREVGFGLLIGGLVQLVFQGVMMAGSIVDLQMGLGISQAMNPVTGVPVSVIAQFKYFLCLVLFFLANGHHTMLHAFIASYSVTADASGFTFGSALQGVLMLLGQVSLLAIQVALPVLAVTIIVDAAFGVMNKAVPTMQVMLMGVPAKVILGLTALAIGLPMMVAYTQTGTSMLFGALEEVFAGVK